MGNNYSAKTQILKSLNECATSGGLLSKYSWCQEILKSLVQFYYTSRDSDTECAQVCSAVRSNQNTVLKNLIKEEEEEIEAEAAENFDIPSILLILIGIACWAIVTLQIWILIRSYCCKKPQTTSFRDRSQSTHPPPNQSTIVNLPLISHARTQTVEPFRYQSPLSSRIVECAPSRTSATRAAGISGDELLDLMKVRGLPGIKTSNFSASSKKEHSSCPRSQHSSSKGQRAAEKKLASKNR